jgi:Prolipoprotein diacylglyceryl transferase
VGGPGRPDRRAPLLPRHQLGPGASALVGPAGDLAGGLGIWGGIALGILGGLFVLRRRGADIPRFLDAAAPALLVAQAIGRVGNYFNQELFGRPTSLPWGLHIDPAHRPAGYLNHATFQPTFLYELIWNLALATALVWLGRRRTIRAPGLFALYVAGYSAFRIIEELLRVDPAHHVLGLRVNFYVASVLTAAGIVWFLHIQRRRRSARAGSRGAGSAALGIAWLLCGLTGCGHGLAAHADARPADARVVVQRNAPPGLLDTRPAVRPTHSSSGPPRR